MDQFETIRALGGGGGGVASLVKTIDTGELLVLKTMYNNGENDIKKAIEAERQMAECRKIDSIYLVKYYDFFNNDEDSSSNIVMEYCPGGDLMRLIYDYHKQKSLIPYPIVKNIIAESIVGLYVLHRAHIIHRDIKPENIFVMENNNVKIGDFGTGKQLESTIAKAGTMIGTQEYEAPEVRGGQKYGFEADIYSLGLVFYQLANCLPKIMDYKPITRTDMPQSLKDVINKLRSENPTVRPTIKDLVQIPVIKEAILELPWESLPPELLDDYSLDAEEDPKPKKEAEAVAAAQAEKEAETVAAAQAEKEAEAVAATQAKKEAEAVAAAQAKKEAETVAAPQAKEEAQLQTGVSGPSALELDLNGNEKFKRLTDEDYETVFGMSRAAFNKLSEFKQISLKKQKKLWGNSK